MGVLIGWLFARAFRRVTQRWCRGKCHRWTCCSPLLFLQLKLTGQLGWDWLSGASTVNDIRVQKLRKTLCEVNGDLQEVYSSEKVKLLGYSCFSTDNRLAVALVSWGSRIHIALWKRNQSMSISGHQLLGMRAPPTYLYWFVTSGGLSACCHPLAEVVKCMLLRRSGQFGCVTVGLLLELLFVPSQRLPVTINCFIH